MDNNLLLTIIILALLLLLFLLASINKGRVSSLKKKKLIEDLFNLKEPSLSEEEAERRDAIIKLDNILSKSLQLYFLNNLSCGDNLKKASKLFRKKNYHELWEVHKMRNRVVHSDYVPSKEEGKKAFEIYKFGIVKILQ